MRTAGVLLDQETLSLYFPANPMRLRDLIEKLFERKRIPNGDQNFRDCYTFKLLRQGELPKFSRRTIQSHTAVWKWIKRLEEKLPISLEKKQEI